MQKYSFVIVGMLLGFVAILASASLNISYAQIITPSYYPLAPCPTCVDPSQPPVGGGTVTPSGTVINPSGSVINPGTDTEPCTASSASIATSKSKHWHHGGGISGFMEAIIRFFIELINMLLKLFGGSPIQIPSEGNPLPTDNPENPGVPTEDPNQPQPTAQVPQPCEPTNAPEPTVSEVPNVPVSPILSPVTSPVMSPATTPIVSDPSSRLFTGDFEIGSFSQWQESQSSGDWSQKIVTDPKRQGQYAARFELRDGDCPVTGGTCFGERTERGAGGAETGGQEGDDRWYQWSTQFGNPFPTSHTWGVTSQWHAQTDGSPPLSFNVDGSNKFGLQIHKQSAPAQYMAVYEPWSVPLDPGTWHDIKIHIHWSASDTTGFIELWHNGAQVTFSGEPCAGQTKCMVRTLTPGGGGTYFKQGYYRDQAVNGTGVIFHDGFTAAKTEAGLGPLQ
jgi:hypothetical protein